MIVARDRFASRRKNRPREREDERVSSDNRRRQPGGEEGKRRCARARAEQVSGKIRTRAIPRCDGVDATVSSMLDVARGGCADDDSMESSSTSSSLLSSLLLLSSSSLSSSSLHHYNHHPTIIIIIKDSINRVSRVSECEKNDPLLPESLGLVSLIISPRESALSRYLTI